MATFTNPNNPGGLTFQIPNDGEVFGIKGTSDYGVRVGNTIYEIQGKDLPAGIVVSNTYNPGEYLVAQTGLVRANGGPIPGTGVNPNDNSTGSWGSILPGGLSALQDIFKNAQPKPTPDVNLAATSDGSIKLTPSPQTPVTSIQQQPAGTVPTPAQAQPTPNSVQPAGATQTLQNSPLPAAQALAPTTQPVGSPVVGATTPVQPNLYSKASGYTGTSIVDFLTLAGQPSDINARTALATQNGITGYTGTSEQNTLLLSKLKGGATSTPATSNASLPTSTGAAVPTSIISGTGSTITNPDIIKLLYNPSLGTSNNYSIDAQGNIFQAPTPSTPKGVVLFTPQQQTQWKTATSGIQAPAQGAPVTAPTIPTQNPALPSTPQIQSPAQPGAIPTVPGQTPTPTAPNLPQANLQTPTPGTIQPPVLSATTPTVPGQQTATTPQITATTPQVPQGTNIAAPNNALSVPTAPGAQTMQNPTSPTNTLTAPNLGQNVAAPSLNTATPTVPGQQPGITAPNLGTTTPSLPGQDSFNSLTPPAFVTDPVNQELLAKYGITPPKTETNPVQSFADTYKQLLTSMGLPDIKGEFDRVQKAYADVQNELNNKITDVNDNPWLSEGERVGRNRSLQQKYENKMLILDDQLKLYDSLYQQGIQQAQYVTNAAFNQQQFNTQTGLSILQLTEQQQAAQNSLSQQKFTDLVEVAKLKQAQGQQTFENQLSLQNLLIDKATTQFNQQLAAGQFNADQMQQAYQNQVTNLNLKNATLQAQFENQLSASQFNSNLAQQIFSNNFQIQQYGSDLKQKQFENQLQVSGFNAQQTQQAYQNQITSTQLRNDELQTAFENQLNAGKYNSDLAQQIFANQMDIQQFQTALKQQNFTNTLATLDFNSKENQQAFQDNLQVLQTKNQTLQQTFSNSLAKGQFDQTAVQQLFDNQLQIQQYNRAATQQNFENGVTSSQLATQQSQQFFQNQLTVYQVKQDQLQTAFDNQLKSGTYNQAIAQQLFENTNTVSQLNAAIQQQNFQNTLETAKYNQGLGQQTFENQVALGQLANQTTTANKPNLTSVGANSNLYQTDSSGKTTLVGSGGADTSASALTSAQKNQTINQIAQNFDNEQIVKDYNSLATNVNFVKSLVNKGNLTSADNQGILYAFAKAMDPNSVVREGEYATVQKYSQSWASSFGFDAMRVLANTDFLTTSAVQNLVSTMDAKLNASQSAYTNLQTEYQKRLDTVNSGGFNSLTNYKQPEVLPAGSTVTQNGIIYQIQPDGSKVAIASSAI